MISELTERRFPIIAPRDNNGRTVLNCPISVPWSLVADHEDRAWANHGQTLSQLAERGGLAPDELHAVVHDRRWRSMKHEDAIGWLSAILEGGQ